jgi:hypothetical protein
MGTVFTIGYRVGGQPLGQPALPDWAKGLPSLVETGVQDFEVEPPAASAGAGRPAGHDRAQPEKPRAVSWLGRRPSAEKRKPITSRAAGGGALDPIERIRRISWVLPACLYTSEGDGNRHDQDSPVAR